MSRVSQKDELLHEESEIITTREHLGRVAKVFDALMAKTGAPASARWEALDAWFRNHRSVEPWGILIRSDGDVVAGALMAHTTRVGMHFFTTAGEAGEPSWLAALDRASAHRLARALSQSLGKPWILQLHDLPAQHRMVEALGEGLAYCSFKPGALVPRLRFVEGQPLNAYASPNTRSAVAKARNRIEAAGLACDLAWTRDPAAIEQCMNELVDVHRRRDYQLRAMSRLDDPSVEALFVDTIAAQARADRVRLLTLRLQGQLAAYAICMETASTLTAYANYASPDWLSYSPGTIVNAEVLRAAHADPDITCLDWGAGVQRYKLSGPVSVDQLQNLRAWSSRVVWLGWASVEVGRRARHFRDRIRQPAQVAGVAALCQNAELLARLDRALVG